MPPLEGRRVALLESRKSIELSTLVHRAGGSPLAVPSVREVLRREDFQPLLQRLTDGGFGFVVVLTAAACEALFDEADRNGVLQTVIEAMRTATVACRGPKPLTAMRRRGLVPAIVTDKPHTTDELLAALSASPLAGADVLLLHYGETNQTFSASLSKRGARVADMSLYDWALPEDLEPLESLIRETIQGRVDVMLFTSQVQFRHLFLIAGMMDREQELTRALRDDVIVGSIGPVCTRVLRERGIVPDVMPRSPNNASLVQATADYLTMFSPAEQISS